nr:hypothetical protein [uncultured Desulfobulbus sp.]
MNTAIILHPPSEIQEKSYGTTHPQLAAILPFSDKRLHPEAVAVMYLQTTKRKN